jgi:uncharacterized protein with GYD domain
MRQVRPRGLAKDEVTYFFLVKDTAKGAAMSAARRKREVNGVNQAVKREGGSCQLYSTKGAAYDFISVVTGISAAAAIRIAAEIEKQGNVKATLISSLEVFRTP